MSYEREAWILLETPRCERCQSPGISAKERHIHGVEPAGSPHIVVTLENSLVFPR